MKIVQGLTGGVIDPEPHNRFGSGQQFGGLVFAGRNRFSTEFDRDTFLRVGLSGLNRGLRGC
jgi:hypothetical protein